MSSARRFLLATLPDDAPLPALGPGAWQQLPGLAREHGLSPRVSGLLDRTSAPDDVRQAIRRDAVSAVWAACRRTRTSVGQPGCSTAPACRG